MSAMGPDNRRHLRTPQGTEGFYLEEAYRHRQLLRITEDRFASWGYLPVLTPVFDYYETYRPLLDRSQEERSYRFSDRDGELLMLRSDITLFLAKQMGLALKNGALPKRVYYADSILRHQEKEDISSDEFFQSGAELIGLPGRDGDLEVLMLLHSLLEEMKLPAWRMHIGSRAVLNAVLAGTGDVGKAGELLEIRDREGLIRLMTDAGLDEPESRADLLLFLGRPDEFVQNCDSLISRCGEDSLGTIRGAVNELVELATELSQIAPMNNVRIDISEHGGQPYYTGFTVQAYVEGANAAVASGGRYDELLGAFGSPIPAAGFSLMMRKIEPLSRAASEAVRKRGVIKARGESFAERCQDAASKRKRGERVVLS